MLRSGRVLVFVVATVLFAVAAAAGGVTDVSAVAPDQADAAMVAAAYNAFSAAEAGRDVRLAVWHADYTSARFNSGIAVTNVGSEPTRVRLALFNSEGAPIEECTRACAAELEPRASHYWLIRNLPGIPEDPNEAWGTAIVSGSQPLVVVVNDAVLGGNTREQHDATAYRGISAGKDAAGKPDEVHAPLVLRSGRRFAAAGAGIAGTGGSQVNGITGAGETSIRVLNRNVDRTAEIAAEMFPQGGGRPTSLSGNAGPGEWHDLLVRPSLTLPDGAYAAHVGANQSLGIVSRTGWPAGGGAMIVEHSRPARSVVAPFVSANPRDACSLITISDAMVADVASVNVEFFDATGGRPVLSRTFKIQEGTSITLRPCDEDEFIAGLPKGFVGWVRATVEGRQTLAAQVAVDYATSRVGVAGFQGVPVGDAAERLYAPTVHSYWPAGGSDRMAPGQGRGALLASSLIVVNPNGEAADVRVTYTGLRGDCAGESFPRRPVKVPAMGQTILEPAEDGALPRGCLASAQIDSDGVGVVAVVLDKSVTRSAPTATATTAASQASPTPTATVGASPTPTTPPEGGVPIYLPFTWRPETP